MIPLARTTSDHIPCVIQIGTSIPKAKVFLFEAFWIDQPDFLEIVEASWEKEVSATNSATKIAAKFKNLRRVLRNWVIGLSKIKASIKTCNDVLLILDKLGENMPLNIPERHFRNILKNHIAKLLKHQKEYWKKRYTVRWTKLGDESTKFFHAAATERYRSNIITSLEDDDDGRIVLDHPGKAALI
jgi:hypothetical protein